MSELFTTYEFVVAQKAEGRFLRRRILFVLMYMLYVATFLIVGIITRIGIPLVALVPVTTWILIFFTWRYVSVEYEYSMAGGMMTLSYVYGGKSRKKVAEIRIKDMTRIAPFDGDYIKEAEKYAPERTIDFTSDLQKDNVYFALYETADARRGILYFEVTEQALRVLRYYNSMATVYRR